MDAFWLYLTFGVLFATGYGASVHSEKVELDKTTIAYICLTAILFPFVIGVVVGNYVERGAKEDG